MPKVALSDTIRDWQDLLLAAEERVPEVKGLVRSDNYSCAPATITSVQPR